MITAAICAALTLAAALAQGTATAKPKRAGIGPAKVITEASDGERWTAAQLRSAVPVGGAAAARPASNSGPREVTGETERPLSAHGRLFFQLPGSQARFSCSATVVRSRTANVVFTAGHCVYDTASSQFHVNTVFVPAYRDGQAPYGQYSAAFLYAPSGWVNGGSTSHDIGTITLAEPAQQRVGGRPVVFNRTLRNPDRFTIFGYPALPQPRYDGEKLIACEAEYAGTANTGTPRSIGARPCDMQQGSSGGGWITPTGYLASVVSHGYCDAQPESCGHIFGPYFGTAAIELYKRAGGSENVAVRFTQAPRGSTTNRRPVFRYRASASTPVTFQCQIGRRPFSKCGATRRLARLDPGRHRFRVRATDQTGRSALIQRAFVVRASRGSNG